MAYNLHTIALLQPLVYSEHLPQNILINQLLAAHTMFQPKSQHSASALHQPLKNFYLLMIASII